MVVGDRQVEGVGIDASYQHIAEAPAYQDPDGETIYATEEPVGTETTEGEPSIPSSQPDVEGQSTFEDWGWSR